MSVQLVIKIKNLDELQARFKRAPVRVGRALNRVVQKILYKIEHDAKQEAPRNKQIGKGASLVQTIHTSMTGLARGKVEVGAEYGVYVHEGTRPHDIYPRVKKALAWKTNITATGVRGGIVKMTLNNVYAHVHHPGTKPNPFMQRAVEKNTGFIVSEIEGVASNLLE